jgi:hypothetical protein
MLSLGRPRPRPNKDTVASTDTSAPAPAVARRFCKNWGSDKPNPVWGVEVGTDRIKSVSTLD